ncbi:MAG: hypothetical protein IID14_07950 [Candidatus Marinimicrobia bacterium]|nr:hypothetical protein [Candidatus Neomarinimicrobiota bacterium]
MGATEAKLWPSATTSRVSYTVHRGDRLFQLVSMDGSPIEYELTDALSTTTRGTGGFGSTG